MANKEQLRILKQGVEVWNEWRKSNRHIKINLRGANLSRQNLEGADFSEADIQGTNFTNAFLQGTNFSQSKAGLQKQWIIGLVFITFLLSGLLGFLLRFFCIYISTIAFDDLNIYFSEPPTDLVIFIARIFAGSISVAVGLTLALANTVFFATATTVAGIFATITVVIITIAIIISSVFISPLTHPFVTTGAVVITLFSSYLSWCALIEDPNYTFIRRIAITFACIGGTSFLGADLTEANFTSAKLKSTDLRKAILTRVRWHGAKMLDRVRPGDTYLKEAQVRQWLIGKGIDKNFASQDLRGVNLQGANLTNASFIDADLSKANLRDADLSKAKMIQAQLDETDLTGATLTEACIQDWNINSQTCLDYVICDYVFLKESQQERRPSLPETNFEPGDFAKLVGKSLETVDLIFRKGVDWRAVAYSIKNTQVLNEDTPLAIQSIENKGDGVVLIKVNVPKNADKGKIEGDFWQGYEFANKTLKEQYEARLLDKDKEINRLFTIVTQEKEVQKLMAEQPKVQQTFNAPINAVAGNVEGNQNIYVSEQKQTLAQAAAEIQKLLKQLEESNPTATVEQQKAYVDAAISPTLKQRCIGALKAGGETAIEEFLDNPYVNVGKAVVKGWMKPE